MVKKCAVVFGGTGFIGAFFVNYLLDNSDFDYIYLVDIEQPNVKKSKFRVKQLTHSHKLKYLQWDVRKLLDDLIVEGRVDLIANFAAIHREPGHRHEEYFETNILGAENICRWADLVACKNIIFTSSISPYGPGEKLKCEKTLPNPSTAYGSSKLVAEKIHEIWQAKEGSIRHLVIVRPGVVFGPGEYGNVSRLIKAVTHRYFFFMGNQSTRKAGVYVRELCNAIWWLLQHQLENNEFVTVCNVSMNPGPSIKDYVDSVCKTQKIKRFIPLIPYKILLFFAYFIEYFSKIFKIQHPFSPVRIEKLIKSNNIYPSYLVDQGYDFKYTLDMAFSDWKILCPEEWE